MAIDKTIFELPDVTLEILQAAGKISFVAQIEGYAYDFQVPAEIFTQYLNNGKSNDVYGGATNPDPSLGTNGDLYFQSNGKIYQKINGSWVLKGNLGGNLAEPKLPAGVQLTEYTAGRGLAYRTANIFGKIPSVDVAVDGQPVNFVPYDFNDDFIDIYLPEYDNTGKTTQAYNIYLKGGNQSFGDSNEASVKSVATYSAMLAEGTPSKAIFYEVLNDEDKGLPRTTYLWKSNGNREWLASTPDNDSTFVPR
jgi:hypothetical protein